MTGFLRQFDGVSLTPPQWRVPLWRARKALKDLSGSQKAVLIESARRIERFHQCEFKHFDSHWQETFQGVTFGQTVRPVDSVCLYVPGGRFAYPSTVLMTGIPARVAGVPRVVMTTPPQHMTKEVLAAAVLAGVQEIYQIGGVTGVGAMAFGTETIKPVDLIVGPGGAWVTEAKRQVFGTTGIDLLAGPSEVVILADNSVNPIYVATDMMAQAEHDPLAKSFLISTDQQVLGKVKKIIEACFLPQCFFNKVKNWKVGVEKSNFLAPEHLSLMVRNPGKLLKNIRHAGAVFMGPWSPVASGDYWAGPSHVLPTGQSARFSSGLSVQTFMKRSSLIHVSEKEMKKKGLLVSGLAEAEGMAWHAESLIVRRGGPCVRPLKGTIRTKE